MQEKEDFLRTQIEAINSPNYTLNDDGVALFSSTTNLKNYLNERFATFIESKENRDHIFRAFESKNYTRSKIPEIANDLVFYKKDVEIFLNNNLQKEIMSKVNKDEFIESCLDNIKSNCTNDKEFNFSKNSLKKLLNKQFDFLGSNGFPKNILNINSGVMTANAGDSAQFLFLARAILAGYNCSNVDVRSSRYDAVIDYNGKLLRIQIKGVSGTSISFKDRDRGGQGIDHKHDRNIGQRITSEDCDIYVAVDKEVGLCYIIPMKERIDPLDDNQIKSISLNDVSEYRENWGVINSVADLK